jgi:CubicO group peptidase (beta-lactamase class C family)
MTANHIGDLPVWLTGPGFGFGLGYSVGQGYRSHGTSRLSGVFGWGGAFCTYFQVDPKEEMIAS